MKLISMTDFVLGQTNADYKELKEALSSKAIKIYMETLQRIDNYATFLKRPLELSMFIPCDEKGNVLENPSPDGHSRVLKVPIYLGGRKEQYQKAKERVLFEGFEKYKKQSELPFDIDSILFNYENPVIEDLLAYPNDIDLTLTDNAIKELGL